MQQATLSTRRRLERGFSMAEVLVAVALLSVILLALFGLVTAGVNRAYGGKKMTQATILAEAVLERANVEAPQTLLGGAAGDSTVERAWDMSGTSVTPAAESGSTVPVVERNAWRNLLATSGLPSRAGAESRLTVTMDALPTGRTFANAATVRIVVQVRWEEFQGRQRTVRLQALNVRATDL